jgi:hypothetical protein
MDDALSLIGLDGEHEQAECRGCLLDRGANGVVGGDCHPVCFAIEPHSACHKVQLQGLSGFADTGAITTTDKGQVTATSHQCSHQADHRPKSGLNETEQSNLAKTEKSQASSLQQVLCGAVCPLLQGAAIALHVACVSGMDSGVNQCEECSCRDTIAQDR